MSLSGRDRMLLAAGMGAGVAVAGVMYALLRPGHKAPIVQNATSSSTNEAIPGEQLLEQALVKSPNPLPVDRKVSVAMVGLGFGAEFIPIYQAHPNAVVHSICQRTRAKLDQVGDRFNIKTRHTVYSDLLADPAVDLVHINSPIQAHGQMTLQALRAGKHVICTVPMATTIEECREIVELVKRTGLKYMMAETVVYSREYLFIKQMYDRGELGDIQYLQASHPQDMEGWPAYWETMVPMHYATHCVSPCLGLIDGLAESVSCHGSGKLSDDLARKSGTSHAVQTCHIKVKDSNVVAHVWRALFDTARQYRESFDVYGTKRSFEWTLEEGGQHVVHTAKLPEHKIPSRISVPDFALLLPPEIRQFTQSIQDADHLSFVQGGGHGGSHPHMVHAFVSALINDTDPWVNAVRAANWTCVGIVAHESAKQGGASLRLPAFTLQL